VIWAIASQGGSVSGEALAVDNLGNIYLTGKQELTTVDYNPSQGSSTYSNPHAYLAKYSSSGVLKWVTHFEAYIISDVELDGNDNAVYVSGSFTGNNSFRGIDPDVGVNTNIVSKGGTDGFLCRFDSIGNLSWVNTMGGLGNDYATDVAISTVGIVPAINSSPSVTGSFEQTCDFDQDYFNGTGYIISNGQSDIFLVSYNVNGILNYVHGN